MGFTYKQDCEFKDYNDGSINYSYHEILNGEETMLVIPVKKEIRGTSQYKILLVYKHPIEYDIHGDRESYNQKKEGAEFDYVAFKRNLKYLWSANNIGKIKDKDRSKWIKQFKPCPEKDFEIYWDLGREKYRKHYRTKELRLNSLGWETFIIPQAQQDWPHESRKTPQAIQAGKASYRDHTRPVRRSERDTQPRQSYSRRSSYSARSSQAGANAAAAGTSGRKLRHCRKGHPLTARKGLCRLNECQCSCKQCETWM